MQSKPLDYRFRASKRACLSTTIYTKASTTRNSRSFSTKGWRHFAFSNSIWSVPIRLLVWWTQVCLTASMSSTKSQVKIVTDLLKVIDATTNFSCFDKSSSLTGLAYTSRAHLQRSLWATRTFASSLRDDTSLNALFCSCQGFLTWSRAMSFRRSWGRDRRSLPRSLTLKSCSKTSSRSLQVASLPSTKKSSRSMTKLFRKTIQ